MEICYNRSRKKEPCMYKMKLVNTNKEILRFEQMRYDAFKYQKEVQKETDCSFYNGIESGDMIALECLEEEQIVGGVLVEEKKKNLRIARIFVKENHRGKGVGTFMLQYLNRNQSFFEDYYGTQLNGIVAEPLASATDFYFEQGYDYSGYQMYKRFESKKHKSD